MKVFEIINPDLLKYSKKIENPEDIPNVITISNLGKQYKVLGKHEGKDFYVMFDNRDGIGATPNNAEVNYFGFGAIMPIHKFLGIAADHKGQREDSAKDVKDIILAGYGLGAPTLYLDVTKFDTNTNTGLIQTDGHEGRARAICCEKYFGIDELPVHIFVKGGWRNRDITDEFTNALNELGVITEDHFTQAWAVRNAFKKVIK